MVMHRVCHICHIISGDLWAGAEVMACHLLKRLHVEPGFKISIVLLNHGRLESELTEAGLQVFVVEEAKFSFFQLRNNIRKLFANLAPDVIHSHRYKENVLAFLSTCGCSKSRLVTTQHGLPETYNRSLMLSDRFKQGVNFLILKYFYSTVVAVSRDILTYFLNDKGFSLRRVCVIQNGVLISQHLSSSPDAKSFIVGSSGRLFPVKDYPLMVEIARAVVPKGDIHFALAGDGPERSKLEDGIDFASLQSSFKLLGHLDDMDPFYAGLSVYINTSVHEGIPMTILEAMARGLPIIAPRVGGIPEVVDDGVQGFLIDGRDPQAFAEKIMLLYKDRELWQRMSVAAREKAERCFSVERMAQGYLDIYRKLCAEKI